MITFIIKTTGIPRIFVCPITKKIMEDPVTTKEGFTFERAAIEEWLENNSISPVTREPLDDKSVIPNFLAKSVIQSFKDNSFTISDEDFFCSITGQLMRAPVLTEDGQTYGKAAIETWLSKSNISPTTGLTISKNICFPNYFAGQVIELITKIIKQEKFQKELAATICKSFPNLKVPENESGLKKIIEADLETVLSRGSPVLGNLILHSEVGGGKFKLFWGTKNLNILRKWTSEDGDQQYTALHILCQSQVENINEVIEMMGLLIAYGADLEKTDFKSFTPLHYVANVGNNSCIKFLLDNGANIGTKTAVGNFIKIERHWYGSLTALHYAVEKNHLEAVALLLDCGADVNSKAEHGLMPLHIAAAQGDTHIEMVELLLQRGAFIDTQDEFGCTALHFCLLNYKSKFSKVFELLLKHNPRLDLKMSRGEGLTPLLLSVANYEPPQLELAEILLRHMKNNASLNFDEIKVTLQRIVNRCTVVCHNEDEMFPALKLLHSYYPYLEARTKDATTLLHFAAWKRLEKISVYLVQKGANVNAKNKFGITPLHLTLMYSGSFEIAKLLIESHADVNAKMSDLSDMSSQDFHFDSTYKGKEYTPLQLVVWSAANAENLAEYHIDLIRILIQHGADCDVLDEQGRTPVKFLIEKGKSQLAEVILQEKVARLAKEKVAALEQEISEKEKIIQTKNKIIEGKDETIALKEEIIRQRDEVLKMLENRLEEINAEKQKNISPEKGQKHPKLANLIKSFGMKRSATETTPLKSEEDDSNLKTQKKLH